MAQIAKPNEELGGDEELVATDHRDAPEPNVRPEDEQVVETPGDTPREALEELGADVASTPTDRGQGELPGERDDA
ncbi:hypothetical protein [Gulosibacter sp. 10]|uniref:hypothetical protein n=1 Tax=Gulosibacter sp. 10 TaxID=1255570 RepID=UPI00097F17C7|nr:hypothetical protein [Gulosibacter sp. 10]SJM62784.1 hypothetical protein FM112_08760 [Gulosibacter sp. 10]